MTCGKLCLGVSIYNPVNNLLEFTGYNQETYVESGQSFIQFDFLKYELFTAVACIMSKTVSPTPRNFSAIDRTVGSGIADASGLWGFYELCTRS